MKIKNIKLKNFGIHRELEFNSGSAPVVGLLGKNGSGKSTILEAVKYALTGEIEGKIEDACTVGKKKGHVELLIEKDGSDVRILREVGKTPKREFERDGKVVTVAKDIDVEIQSLLSVDKKALSNACFLKQGSLNDLLFGTESSREQLFIKLVNLSFCERYSNVVDTKLKALEAGAEDLQSLSDEINIQRMDAVVEKELLEKQLSRVVDYKPVMDLLGDNMRLDEKCQELSEEISSLKTEASSLTSKLGTIYLAHNITDRSGLEEKVSRLRSEYTEVLELKSKAIENKNSRVRYDKTVDELKHAKTQIEELENKISDDKSALESLIAPDVKLESNSLELDRVMLEVKSCSNWLGMYHSHESGSIHCPTCGTDLSGCTSEEDARLKQEELERLVVEKARIDAELNSDRGLLSNYEKSKANLVANIQLDTIRLEHMSKSFGKLTETVKELVDQTDFENEVEDIKKFTEVVEKLADDIKDVESDNIKIVEYDTKLKSAEIDVISKKTVLDTSFTQKVSNEESISKALDDLNIPDHKELPPDKLLSELENKQKVRSEAEGRLKQATENFSKVCARYSEIQDRMTKNRSRLAVASELRDIKSILSKKGLPSAYIAHKFEVLSKLTSDNLAILNADFTVDKDPDAFLSFVFDRFDGSDMVRLPMSRLSGGQKVRLCIAFLLAVQQELVPDIGFQTFDEPSTHLDEEGVERLCTMFKSLQDLLRCIDHQVWVCDHNPLLEESFSTTLNLQ